MKKKIIAISGGAGCPEYPGSPFYRGYIWSAGIEGGIVLHDDQEPELIVRNYEGPQDVARVVEIELRVGGVVFVRFVVNSMQLVARPALVYSKMTYDEI